MENSEWMTAAELARWLKMDVKALYWLNYTGKGPRRHRVGRELRYRMRDVERWLAGLAEG